MKKYSLIFVTLIFSCCQCNNAKKTKNKLIGIWYLDLDIVDPKINPYTEIEITSDKIYVIELFKKGKLPTDVPENYKIIGDTLVKGDEDSYNSKALIRNVTRNSFEIQYLKEDEIKITFKLIRVLDEKESWGYWQEENNYKEMGKYQLRLVDRNIDFIKSKRDMSEKEIESMRRSVEDAILFYSK